ncbi:MAG: hypothetical protein JSR58_05225 [Verrucomicrobia bacterium]|nr:hypothetical protein [Verrucomicrobiota bacterium]
MQALSYDSQGPFQAFDQKATSSSIPKTEWRNLEKKNNNQIIVDRQFRAYFPLFKSTLIRVPGEASYVPFSEIKDGSNISLAITSSPYEKHFGIFWKTIAHIANEKKSSEIAIVMICAQSQQQSKDVGWDPYWSEGTLFLEDVSVKLDSQESTEHVIYRTFTLQCQNKTTTVKHYHFHMWLDGEYDIPSIVEYGPVFKKLTECICPVVVHCRAGIFRSGIVSIALMTLKKLQVFNKSINEEVVDRHIWESLDALRHPETGRSYLMAPTKDNLLVARKIVYHVWNSMKSQSSDMQSFPQQISAENNSLSSLRLWTLLIREQSAFLTIRVKRRF